MEIENRNTSFIRDLIVKVLLIVLFIFLLMFLFPMPNLTPFYDAIFNNNVQTMKNAAEKWYTTDRMPEEIGDIDKLTLQDMLDKKLILPFVDKDGNECDTEKSYVSVKKTKDEYVMKVSLTCGNKTNYIIEHIGCYNFCKDGTCTEQVAIAETDEETGETVVKSPIAPTKNVKNNSRYATEYEYQRNRLTEKWTLGNWINNTIAETNDIKLANTRTQYTGQKQVSKDTTLYKHIKYKYVDDWTYDTEWTEEVKTLTDDVKLFARVTLYTGKKKIVEPITKYYHVKYGIKDNWSIIEWSNQERTTNNSVVEIGKRYLVRKTVKTTTTAGKWSDWKKDNTWRTSKPSNTSTKQWGSSYDSKTESSSSWSAWKNDTTWYSSKPSNTSTKQWGSAYNSKTVTTTSGYSWELVNNSYASRTSLGAYSSDGNYKYEFLTTRMEDCTTACNGNARIQVYYYRQYKKVANYNKTTQYQYTYRTLNSSSTKYYKYLYRTYAEKDTVETNTDEKYVTDATSYVKDGYTVIRTEFRYKVNSPEKYKVADIWTDSITPPEGYEYTNQSSTVTIIKYEDLDKWVSSKDKLGEYTYYVETKDKYKYKYNNPKKVIEKEIITDSKVSPEGYEFDSVVGTDSSKKSYVDLGEWVNSKEELGEYTHNIKTRTQYQYKYRTTSSSTETKWSTTNPGGDWKPTGNSRTIKVN